MYLATCRLWCRPIDSAEKVAAAAEAIEGMLEDGLIVISGADVVRLVRSQSVTGGIRCSTRKPLRFFGFAFRRWIRDHGTPLYEAIVAKCRESQIACATVFRGLEGYGETAEMHRGPSDPQRPADCHYRCR